MKIISSMKPEHNHLNKKNVFQQYKINKIDVSLIGYCCICVSYLVANEPLFLIILGCFSIVFLGIWSIVRKIPIFEQIFHNKIRFWHLASIIISLTVVLSIGQTPAHAVFLSGLENFFQELATDASTAGGETIDEDVITFIFNLIRGIFLLLVAAASLFAYNQAQQGNDWRPIIVQIGLAFGIVIAIDIITFLFIGGSTTGAT